MSKRFQYKTGAAILVALLVSACASEKPAPESWKNHFDDGKFSDIQLDYDKAKRNYSLALEKLAGVEGEGDWRAEILARLARLEVIGGNLKGADQLANQALKLTLDPKSQGPNHGEVLIAIDDLAEAYSERAYKSKADQKRCLEMCIKLLDGPFKRPSKVLGRSQAQLAVVYLMEGNKAKAKSLTEVIVTRAKKTGAHQSIRQLAVGYKIAGDDKTYREIVEVAKKLMKNPGREGVLTAALTLEEAKLYSDNGRYAEAARTITDFQKKIAPRKLTADFYEELAHAYERQEKFKDADATFEEALKVDRQNPAHRKDLRKRMDSYVRYLRRTNRPQKAEELQQEADGLRDQTF